MTSEILDELDAADQAAPTLELLQTPREANVLGVAASNTSDVLVLRMLRQLLAPAGLTLQIIEDLMRKSRAASSDCSANSARPIRPPTA